ncbi:hypothetical protein LSH36_670g00039 [Paralvinella palmiformis]|uniref:BPTI/Kunitz inhibitor domain-containing protein n=1 Tax=Paralvinella palmiformis TaxID=53620 RepID=A0AAD9J3Y0_9ANNE|nr:hypothetical protein LSH36_670g00039 [Paralvinella palmiformis]
MMLLIDTSNVMILLYDDYQLLLFACSLRYLIRNVNSCAQTQYDDFLHFSCLVKDGHFNQDETWWPCGSEFIVLVVGDDREHWPGRSYYFNTQVGECQTFVYGGCGGNENNFERKEDCESTCSRIHGDFNTLLPMRTVERHTCRRQLPSMLTSAVRYDTVVTPGANQIYKSNLRYLRGLIWKNVTSYRNQCSTNLRIVTVHANEATSLDVIEYAEHTPGTFNYLVNRFISNRLESIYTDYTSASKDWYQKTTVVGHNILNNRLADSQLRRLRFWAYTRNFTGASPLTLCRHCQQVYDPIHYLLSCPAYPKQRRILKGHLRPEDYKLPDRHLVALLKRKSTFLPDFITPLLQKDPYIY